MPDREKVIKGLECHIHPFQCNDCPYWDKSQPLRDCDVEQMAKDALALLTDTTSWIKEPNRRNHWNCEKCGCVVGLAAWMYTYCPVCGRKVTGGIEFDG